MYGQGHASCYSASPRFARQSCRAACVASGRPSQHRIRLLQIAVTSPPSAAIEFTRAERQSGAPSFLPCSVLLRRSKTVRPPPLSHVAEDTRKGASFLSSSTHSSELQPLGLPHSSSTPAPERKPQESPSLVSFSHSSQSTWPNSPAVLIPPAAAGPNSVEAPVAVEFVYSTSIFLCEEQKLKQGCCSLAGLKWFILNLPPKPAAKQFSALKGVVKQPSYQK